MFLKPQIDNLILLTQVIGDKHLDLTLMYNNTNELFNQNY